MSLRIYIFLGSFNRWSRQDLGGMNFPLIISVDQTRYLKCGRSHIRKILDKTKRKLGFHVEIVDISTLLLHFSGLFLSNASLVLPTGKKFTYLRDCLYGK